jgi:large subunit ribosomal protein L23
MNQERIFQIIRMPHISEKSAVLGDAANQAVFQVASDARKPEIKEAVEQLFNVKVANVRTANMKGKTKRQGLRRGKRSDWKKAYVSLEQGHEIYWKRKPKRADVTMLDGSRLVISVVATSSTTGLSTSSATRMVLMQ